MKPKVLAFLVVLCVGLGILVTDGFSATARKSSDVKWTRHISEDIRVDAPGWELYGAPSTPISKYRTGGAKDDHPECRDNLGDYTNFYNQFGLPLEHDQIGHTWYDFQKNGSMGRMISVTNDGYRHYSWTYCETPYPDPGPRWTDGNCYNASTGWYVGQQHVYGGANKNAGYSNQTHLNDGRAVVIHHRTAGVGIDPSWWSMISIEEVLCSGSWPLHFDIPDNILNAPSSKEGQWPKADVVYDEIEDKNYIHVVMTEGETAGGVPVMVAYERCKISGALSNTMICESFVNGATQSYTIVTGVNYSNPPTNVISHFDFSCSVTPVVKVSPVSKRMAIAYLKPADPAGTCDYLCDVCYIESMNNGNDWIDGTNWPPSIYNLTNFGTEGYERAFHDLNACYDFRDSLHIVYVTCGFEQGGYYQPGVARLYHWSKEHGIGLIHTAIWPDTDPGGHNCNIAKMSVSAKDPIYHPGGDSVYLYCIWTQFDLTDPPDESDAEYTNGEIYGCGSFDGGYTWGRAWNLTGTRTPGCVVGECLSEHWSSLAQNMYNGDLHIQYICDRHPGTALPGQDVGSEWTDNAVMYLRLEEWPITEPKMAYTLDEPDQPNWYQPPLKVIPGGSRPLVLTIYSVGNADLEYDAYGDHGCIQGSYSGPLPPGQSVTLTFTLSGSGVCADIFIDGNIVIETNELDKKTHKIPVQAVVAKDYYECPRDPETFVTLENGVLRLYVNANCEERIHDMTLADPMLQEVFFEGGTIVAITQDGDPLVGRFMLNPLYDWRNGVRDKLYTELCDAEDWMNWEPPFWIVYTKNVFMHNINPPTLDFRWWWWELSKQIKLFKDTPETPEAYKHIVIKYVRVQRHDPPGWWPDQTPFDHYENTYIGVAEDIDCPSNLGEPASNWPGYDVVNEIAWQRGWGPEGHPYNNYYCGIALADAGMPGENMIPYGCYNVRNDIHLYPQAPWGWLDQDLYDHATPLGVHIEDELFPDGLDRTWVFTAQEIPAGDDPLAEAYFTVVKVVAPDGEDQLREYVQTAREIVEIERSEGGLPAICGDMNGDFIVDLGDRVHLDNYIYRNIPLGTKPPPLCPIDRGDVNSDGVIDLGDAVYLNAFLYRNIPYGTKPAPKCPGIWYYPYAYNP